MARYKRSPKTYTLHFEDDTEFAGLQVTCRPANTGEVLEVAELDDAADGNFVSNPAAIGRLIDILADVIVEWNLDDDDDKPVPATASGLRDQDPELVAGIVRAWVGASSRVAPPLPAGSSPGEIEAGIPMEVLDASLSSEGMPA